LRKTLVLWSDEHTRIVRQIKNNSKTFLAYILPIP